MISVIVPTLNEPEVGNVIREIKKLSLDAEIIVIDKSTDDTPAIARKSGASVFAQRTEGYGNAYREGFQKAKGDILVMIDGDGTYEAADIPKMIGEIRGGADLVLGNRFANLEKGSMDFKKRIGNMLVTALLNRLYGLKLKDSQSGLRAIRRSFLSRVDIGATGMSFATEMLIRFKRAGARITDVPSSYRRRTGKTKLRFLRYGASISLLLLREMGGRIRSLLPKENG